MGLEGLGPEKRGTTENRTGEPKGGGDTDASPSGGGGIDVPAEGTVAYSDAGETDDTKDYSYYLAADDYERRVKGGAFQMREALQDSMLGLKAAMRSIVEAMGEEFRVEEIDDFENPYLGENRLSSVNNAEMDAFRATLFEPLMREVARLAKNEEGRIRLINYMMAKHGLERNRVMAERAAEKAFAEDDSKTLEEWTEEFRKRDFAGLTALTDQDDVAAAEAEAQRMVEDYEAETDTQALWEKVNAVTGATLTKSMECGLLSRESYELIKGMYAYYIPLRGFAEDTSADAYAYLSGKEGGFSSPIKKAAGRKSKADDPFANMAAMSDSAIMQGNRNLLVKQRLLNFALNHPSDLISVNDLWLEYDEVNDEWRPVLPSLSDDDTPADIARKTADFEETMQKLAEEHPDKYCKSSDRRNIPYRVVEKSQLSEHQVIVKRLGRDVVLTINGNPRAAQAVNGKTNPDNDTTGAVGRLLGVGQMLNRQLSAFYTTRNPDFVVSNFIRDAIYSNSMVWARESPAYAARFNYNFARVNPARLYHLLRKLRKGRLDEGNAIERAFRDFMANGGETGYAILKTQEQRKRDIHRMVARYEGRIPLRTAWKLLGERLDEVNRAVELCARFAAFVTSRQMGRSIGRSVFDAKEISVNFNKKGAGAKFLGATGQTAMGNTAAMMSGLGRAGYVFWNAALQGTTNFGHAMKRHPAKTIAGAASMFILGAVMAALGQGGGGDDDDDDAKKGNGYYDLPEYVRRSNIVFRPDGSPYWISIPLPVEYRAIYGMGELMTSAVGGHAGEGLPFQMAQQVSQVMPIDVLEGGGGINAFVPSAVKPVAECLSNKSWTVLPLYKQSDYTRYMPRWTKAYKSTNKQLVGLCAVLNEGTGGDKYSRGYVDWSPAVMEHLLTGYFGGVASTIDKLVKTGETVMGERDFDPRSVLLLNRVAKTGDERTAWRDVTNRYFRLKEEAERTAQRLSGYKKELETEDAAAYAEKLTELNYSPAMRRMMIVKSYQQPLDALNEARKHARSDAELDEIDATIGEVRSALLKDVESGE